MADITGVETTQIDALIIANHAEAVNGLLYLSGGGWTDMHRRIQNSVTPPSHFGVGVSVRVPWHETNESHNLVIEVQNDDATVTVARAEGQINVGRPPQLVKGATQHAIVAISIDTVFPEQGGYRVIATLDEGKSTASWPFHVHDERIPG